jgi:hypothetical protein
MKKVIVINGPGGSGKDTLIKIVEEHFSVRNVSSIDCIIRICEPYYLPEDQGDSKSMRKRKLLSAVKQAFSDYNDLPHESMVNEYEKFILDPEQNLMFVHIREPKEIEKYQRFVGSSCVSLLVESKSRAADTYGNSSDDDVCNYNYDYYFTNEYQSVAEAEQPFMDLIKQILNT